MEGDSDNDVLKKIAAGETVEEGTWPDLRDHVISRLDKIVHNDFPIPKLPPPPPVPTMESRLPSPLPSSPLEHPSSQEANKDDAHTPTEKGSERSSDDAPNELPKQIDDMLVDIKKHLETFKSYPPHTVQRLTELILHPRLHHRALAPYLHAVDRVVHVTSATNTYPLPPAIPDMSSMQLNGEDTKDPAASVTWRNPTTLTLGTDEALGGALLTPIPWLNRRSPEENNGETTPAPTTPAAGAQIHSEGTETIDGPNGVGSIETVSVSVNGIPSTGHTRGVTQGELLRQEQRAGVVPVTQLTRAQEPPLDEAQQDRDMENGDEEEVPHARGPEEIGVGDTGPQGVTTSYMGEDGGVSLQGIDVEAAVGRKHGDEQQHIEDVTSQAAKDDDASSTSSTESAGTKREASQELEGEHAKRIKEEEEEEEKSKDTQDDSSAPEVQEKKEGEKEEKEETKEASTDETENAPV